MREARPGRLWLEFTSNEPLAETVPALPVSEQVDLEAVAIGLQEDGEPWCVKVLGTHLLVAGATGAGKGSVLWSLLRGLGPQRWPGRGLGDRPQGRHGAWPRQAVVRALRRSDARPAPLRVIAVLLEDAVKVMRRRAQGLADGKVRQHTPTTREPLIVLVIDEIANLTVYLTDRKVNDRITQALGK